MVCDNGGTCVALGNAENSAEPAYVSIVLRAGEARPASVGLMFGALDDTQARRRDLSAAFEGQAGEPAPRTTDTARQTEDDFFRFRLPADRAAGFVERIAAGGVLRLELSAPNAPVLFRLDRSRPGERGARLDSQRSAEAGSAAGAARQDGRARKRRGSASRCRAQGAARGMSCR